MKKLLIALSAILALSVGTTMAPPPTQTTLGVAQPESDASAAGWDNTPAAGNWGGRGADGTFAVAWENDSPDIPELFGRFAEVTVLGKPGYVPIEIRVNFLAGLANDDFCILVEQFKSSSPHSQRNYVAIGCYNEDESNTNEVWTQAKFDLPPNVFHPGQDVTVQIRVTGNAWSGRGTWGQLAVDSVEVIGRQGQGQ